MPCTTAARQAAPACAPPAVARPARLRPPQRRRRRRRPRRDDGRRRADGAGALLPSPRGAHADALLGPGKQVLHLDRRAVELVDEGIVAAVVSVALLPGGHNIFLARGAAHGAAQEQRSAAQRAAQRGAAQAALHGKRPRCGLSTPCCDTLAESSSVSRNTAATRAPRRPPWRPELKTAQRRIAYLRLILAQLRNITV